VADDRSQLGLMVGGVLGLVTFTAGMLACQHPHVWPVHHGFVGVVTTGAGIIARDSFYSPVLILSGLGMVLSDLQDIPEWLTFGTPEDEYETLSY
jgi:hypothetical protein